MGRVEGRWRGGKEVAGRGDEGGDEGARLETTGEDMRGEDQVGVGLVFGVGGVGKEGGGDGHRCCQS